MKEHVLVILLAACLAIIVAWLVAYLPSWKNIEEYRDTSTYNAE